MRIVVVTKNYGTNVTGATVATHTLTHLWAKDSGVSGIVILAQHIFNHIDDDKIKVVQYRTRYNLPRYIKEYNDSDTIFYSDDHYGGFLADARVKYVHTYHGNWPDARWLNLEYFLKSFYFIPKYAKTIKSAAKVVNVSNYMKKFTDKYNKNSVTIRNGVDNSKIEVIHKSKKFMPNKCLMLGNVDARKYGMLPSLIDELRKANIAINIDIYGRIVEKKIAQKLQGYKEVNLHGFVSFSEIDLSQYAFLLSTSTRENLPISIVEILKSKLPVLAFAVGGIPEVIDNTSGRLLDAKEMKNNIEIIRKIIEQRYQFTFDNSVLDEFDWNKSSQKYLRLFRELVI